MHTEDTWIDSGGCRLAGTFISATDPVAAALVITGSGRVDRDSNATLPGGRTLRMDVTGTLARALGESGVSTLRYDKRGVGASEGDYFTSGMTQLRDDACAALNALAARAPGLPLLVVGHSEGAHYAAQLAAEGRVAGVVLLSGPARRGDEVLAWQTANIAARLPTVARIVLRVLGTDAVRWQRKYFQKVLHAPGDVARVRGQRISARWMREFVAYEPSVALSKLTIPVLAITGGGDLQVSPDDVEAVGRLVRGPFEGHVVGDLSHLLRPDPALMGPRGYRRAVRQPISADVPRLITDWVHGHWGCGQ